MRDNAAPVTPINPANEQCIGLLKKWLRRAEAGRMNFIVCIGCENEAHNFSEHAGSTRMMFSANWALDTAKLKMQEIMNGRHLAPVEIDHQEMPANVVRYDMSKGPACFDFVAWLIIAEMNRIKKGAPPPLRVCFTMGVDSDYERALHSKLRAKFYEGVIRPSLALIGAVEDETAIDAPMFEYYTFKAIGDRATNGEEVPLLHASADAMNDAREIFKSGPPPVTITLREAEFYDYRNSDITEWIKLADYLTEQGERVIFIRDTAKAAEEITGYVTCPPASTDIDIRMAVYESAKANLFVSNGPWYLGVFGSKPWGMWVECDHMAPHHAETPQFYRNWHGIDPAKDEQLPWSKPTQRIFYKRDKFENLVEGWETLNRLIKAEARSEGLEN